MSFGDGVGKDPVGLTDTLGVQINPAKEDGNLASILTDTTAIKTAVQLIDNAISGTEMQVDVITMPSLTIDSEFPVAAAITDNFANPTTTNVMAMGMAFDGSTWDRLKGDSTNGLLVNLGSNNDVTVSTITTITNPVGIKNAATDTITGISGTYDTLDVSISNGTYRATVDSSGYLTTNINGSVAVTGTFYQGTQPVSLASVPSHAVTNAGTFAVQIVDTSFAVADGNALGEGVLIQGDDGTDRKNINVDASTGDVQVDVTNVVTVDLAGNNDVTVTSGAITETNSGTIAGDTTSIDGKITACNTGAVVVSSGTITANLGATDNAVLDAIDAVLDTIKIDTEAIETAVELLDNAVDGNYLNTNMNIAGTDVVGGAGVLAAGVQRVTIATDDEVNNLLGTIDADTGAIKTAVEKIDNITGAIIGPAEPTIDSYAHIAINLTTGANQVLVSSAASKQIWIYGYGFTCGDADGQSVSLQDEADTAITGIMEFAQYGGISVPPSGNFAMPIHKLGTDKDLEVDILGGDVDGYLCYAIVSV